MSELQAKIYHVVHVCVFLVWVAYVLELTDNSFLYRLFVKPVFTILQAEGLVESTTSRISDDDTVWCMFLHALRVVLISIVLPYQLVNACGLLVFNSFRSIDVRAHPTKTLPISESPFICFRVVTHGVYPQLVKETVKKNLKLCAVAGLSRDKCMFEVVTDNRINVSDEECDGFVVRDIVVPTTYQTPAGTLFKARDWIVHLDEETLLTVNAINGIRNFCGGSEGRKHAFGQGVIYYARDNVVNWMNTFCDSKRVAYDYGALQFMLSVFHAPWLNWKGSYMVAKAGAERRVTFDLGPDGSIAEDCYFAMKAITFGYTFQFIDGEMDELSPFTALDFVRQRKRWHVGIRLTAHSRHLPMKVRWGIAYLFYMSSLRPLNFMLQMFPYALFPPQNNPLIVFFSRLLFALSSYAHMFGVARSFSHRIHAAKEWPWMIVYLAGGIASFYWGGLLESAAVLLGNWEWLMSAFRGSKHQKLEFYIVEKQHTTVDIGNNQPSNKNKSAAKRCIKQG